jgi:hypothetical protein
MSEHTPGPWKAVPTNPADGGEWYWIVGNCDGHNTEKEVGTVSGPQSGTQKANAMLIAAAPRLRAALAALVDVCHEAPPAVLTEACHALADADGLLQERKP